MSLKQLVEELKKQSNVIEKLKVKLTYTGSFQLNVKAGRHKFILDEEKVIGGTNKGPAPAQLLLTAIGGCMLSTLHVWSDILNIKIDSADVTVKGNINVLAMLGIDEAASAGFQKLTVNLKLKSGASEEQIQQLIENVEQSCPVYNTIVNPNEISLNVQLID
ncbi:MAG: OsmC family protein [Candidatus Helarchaeota archaeon]